MYLWSHTYLNTSDITHICGLSMFRVTWPHTDPMPYIFPYTAYTAYTAYTTYTAFSFWNLSTVPSVNPTHSCVQISEWDQAIIEYSPFLLVGMNPIIRSLNFLNRFPWSGLVIKFHVVPFVGHHSTVTYFVFIQSVTKKNRMFLWLVILLPEYLPFFSINMDLWLSC